MKNNEIATLYEELNTLHNKKLPIGVSFAINRNVKKLRDVAEEIEESRLKLIREYAEKDKDGNVKTSDDGNAFIPKESQDAFVNEYDSLMNIDTEVSLETITMEDIEKCDIDKYDSLTVDECAVLEKLIQVAE